jgi:rhodanese-related sulfurtransferase
MTHDVFISYSTRDKPAADAVCHGLEDKGIRCWVAPRDQIAGKPYGEQIAAAIEGARVMVLVFSDNANNSHAVHNEINLAANANITIVPFRIARVEFNPELHFYLGRMHWLDAFPKPVDQYIDALAATVQRNLGDAGAAAAAAEARPRAPPRTAWAPSRGALIIAGAVLASVLALALMATIIGLLLRQPSPLPQSQPQTASATLGPGDDTKPVRPANAAQVADFETVVTPSGPPLTLSGATVINTAQMADKIRAHDAGQIHLWLIDARGCSSLPTLPTADCLNPNTIDQLKSQVPTKTMELIFFCLDGSCPESYQAAKQALAAGYRDVLWYRGGVNAWSAAGLPTVTYPP